MDGWSPSQSFNVSTCLDISEVKSRENKQMGQPGDNPPQSLPCPWAFAVDRRPAPFPGPPLELSLPNRARLRLPPACKRGCMMSPGNWRLWVPYDRRTCLLINVIFLAFHGQCHRADGQVVLSLLHRVNFSQYVASEPKASPS